MSGNGTAPQLRLANGGPPSTVEAAAIAAALERFLADTMPPPRAPRSPSAWARAALLEGVDRDARPIVPTWGDPEPWGRALSGPG
jgi:hypothetical protein